VISKRLDHQLERLAEAFNGWTVYGEVSPLVAEKIYLHLSKIETNELEQKQLITKIDRYHWFLFVALLLLMVAYALPRAQHVWNRQK
jgi:TRAP-type mannitol/chloroaromatic compound transport system permease small subunit